MEKHTDFSKLSLEELTPIVSMRAGMLYSKEELALARRVFMARLNNEEMEIAEETPALSESTHTEVSVESAEAEVFTQDAIMPVVEKPDETEFILKSENRFARILYRIYAYILLPFLSLEAILILLESVATATAIPTIPYLFSYIAASVFYTMFVAITWHQFLFATRTGLILSRILIFTCIGRGVCMVSSPESRLTGILFLTVSILFLVFFFGYENTFVKSTPKQRHGR